VPKPTALFDANVLASITLTDLIVESAHQGLFKARWSDDIHAEWTRAVVGANPALDPAKIARRRQQMDANTDEALVTGYADITPNLTLPDLGDRHVLAAAIVGLCDTLVTFNLKHFPAATLATHGVTPMHPDLFFLDCFADDELAVLKVLKTCRARMKAPPLSADDYLARLHKVGLPLLSARLAGHTALL
jgi:PIN domain